MTKFKSFLLFNFLFSVPVLLFLSVPASAFSDNFNSGSLAGYTVSAGCVSNWTFATPGMDSSQYLTCAKAAPLFGSSEVGGFSHTVEANPNYFSIDMYSQLNTVSAAESKFYFEDNGSSSHYVSLYQGVSSGYGQLTAQSDLPYFNSVSLPVTNTWYSIKISTSGNSITVNIYNATSLLVSSQTFSYFPVINSSRVSLGCKAYFTNGQSTVNCNFDNLYTSSGALPGTTNTISWASSERVGNGVVRFDWAVSDSDWTATYLGLSYQMRAKISKGSTELASYALSSQTGFDYFEVTSDGSYVVTLEKWWDGCYFGCSILGYTPTELATSSLRVLAEGTSSIVIPSGTLMTGVLNTIQVKFGFTPNSERGLLIYNWDRNQYVLELYAAGSLPWGSWSWSAAPISGNTWYNVSFVPSRTVKYKLVLYDLNHQEAVVKYVTASAVPNFPTTNLTSSYLIVNKTTLAFGDYIIADYGIDKNNFSIPGTRVYLALYNFDRSFETSSFFLPDQVGKKFYQLSSTQQTCGVDYGCMSLQGDIYGIAGNNSLRLVNSSGNILAQTNITILSKTAEGYALSLSNYNICVGQKTTAIVTTPNSSFLSVYKDGIKLKSYNVSTVDGFPISLMFNTFGTYELRLTSFDGIDKFILNVNVPVCVPGGTPSVTVTQGKPLGEVASSMSSNLLNIMVLPVFWGIILWVLVVYAVASGGKQGEDRSRPIELTAVILAVLEAIAGLWEPYTMFVIAIIIILLGVKFYQGKKIVTEGG
ncbi:MAG: hypothetical protein PHV30_09105 [Candidatus Margulisbacteria bacterium]|nr:hypothetical protein [Candidatus Margulisiibacteriota bacterium]